MNASMPPDLLVPDVIQGALIAVGPLHDLLQFAKEGTRQRTLVLDRTRSEIEVLEARAAATIPQRVRVIVHAQVDEDVVEAEVAPLSRAT